MDPLTIGGIFSIGGKLIDKLVTFWSFGVFLSTNPAQRLLLQTRLFGAVGRLCGNLARYPLPILGLSWFFRKQIYAVPPAYFWLARFGLPTCSCMESIPYRYQFSPRISRLDTLPYQTGIAQIQATRRTHKYHAPRNLYTLCSLVRGIACTSLPILCKFLSGFRVLRDRALLILKPALPDLGTHKTLKLLRLSCAMRHLFGSRRYIRIPKKRALPYLQRAQELTIC